MVNILSKSLCESCFSAIETEPCPECGYSRSTYEHDRSVLPIGSVLEGRYMIGRVLGKGGFGITYLAYDMKLGYKVAIKEYYPMGAAVRNDDSMTVLTQSDSAHETFKSGADKFYSEARLVAELSENPNIINVSDVFYENETVYFTMGYLQGRTLKNYLEKSGKISEEQAVYIAGEVANALASAHEINVLHRDISPDNIMVCTDGTVKLLDFGAARQVVSEGSASLSVILKQGYAPLEQYQKKGKQGPWTDIYALGATIYFSLTNDLMEDPMTRMDDDEEFSSNKYGISPALWGIIQKATMIRTSERYQDIYEFLDALDDCGIAPQPLVQTDKRARRYGSISRRKIDNSGVQAAPAPAMEATVALNDTPASAMEATVALNDTPAPAMNATVALNDTSAPAMNATVALNDTPTPAMNATVALNDTPAPAMNATVALNDTPAPAMNATVALNDTPAPAMNATVALNDTPASSMNVTVALDSAASQRNSPPPRQSTASERDDKPLFRGSREDTEFEADMQAEMALQQQNRKKKFIILGAAAAVVVIIVAIILIDLLVPGYRYRKTDGGVEISSLKGIYGSTVEIPSKLGGKPVVAIGDSAFSYSEKIESIIIPDGVTKIGDHAFRGCTSLKSITIPNGVTKIESSAFNRCTSLESITIPDSVVEIGARAFDGCTSLESITIPDSVTKIGSTAFYKCESLKSITIPDSVTQIGNKAFYGCTNLKTVSLPKNCQLGEDVFKDCPNVKIEIRGGSSSADAQQPTSSEFFTYQASGDGISITKYTGSDSEVEIPAEIDGKAVVAIGYNAFSRCGDIKSVTIPDSVTFIGNTAFLECADLTSITIPDSVTWIGNRAFQECTSLTSIVIPDSVTMINEGTFYGCESLESITIPDSVTSIGRVAFMGCKNLKTVSLPKNCQLGKDVFKDCPNVKIETRDGSSSPKAPEESSKPQKPEQPEQPEQPSQPGGAAANSSAAELRFDVIYYYLEGDNVQYLRFFSGGKVVSVSITKDSSKTIEATTEVVIGWFDENWHVKGRYEVDGNNIEFYTESGLNKTEYAGEITNDGLSLDFSSKYWGTSGHYEYKFFEIK